MIAYYNEHDPFASQWLRNLINAGLIPAGHVDDRDIRDVTPKDLDGFVQCHFFAGIAGWPLALSLAGWPATRPVWTGSCPCQPFSRTGKRLGFADERHLWPAWLPLIRVRRPAAIFGEQVTGPLGREWLTRVRADLEDAGYAFGATDLCAAGVKAPHIRSRLYWMADADGAGWHARHNEGSGMGHGHTVEPGRHRSFWDDFESDEGDDGTLRRISSRVFPLAHGVSARVAKLRAAGNAIVPQVAAEFIMAVTA